MEHEGEIYISLYINKWTANSAGKGGPRTREGEGEGETRTEGERGWRILEKSSILEKSESVQKGAMLKRDPLAFGECVGAAIGLAVS